MSAVVQNHADVLRAQATSGSRPALGGWLTIDSAEILLQLASSGLDYVGIDCQHGSLTEGEAARLLAASPPVGAPRIVRLAGQGADGIGRALDSGAEGLIIPAVESADQARAIVIAARFPPEGARSYGPISRYLPRDPAALESRTLLLAMIETELGLENVEEILAVPGIDGIYVGPADLGIALGVGHAQFPPSEQLEGPLQLIAEAGHRAGKIVGAHAGDEAYLGSYVRLGFGLLTLGTQSNLLKKGVDRALEAVGRGSTSRVETAPY